MELEDDAVKFARQAYRLLETFNSTNHPPTVDCCQISHVPARTACVIHLHDRWSDFCKNLLIHSAVGGNRNRAGNVLSRASQLPQSDDPVSRLRSFQRGNPPTYWEPNWTVTHQYIRACNQLGLSNASDVTAAIGSTLSPAQELRVTRNYLAHRKKSTAMEVISELAPYGAQSPLMVDDLLTGYVSGGVSLFEQWVSRLMIVAFTACD